MPGMKLTRLEGVWQLPAAAPVFVIAVLAAPATLATFVASHADPGAQACCAYTLAFALTYSVVLTFST